MHYIARPVGIDRGCEVETVWTRNLCLVLVVWVCVWVMQNATLLCYASERVEKYCHGLMFCFRGRWWSGIECDGENVIVIVMAAGDDNQRAVRMKVAESSS